MTRMGDLLGPDPVLLPGDSAAEAELAASENPAIVAAAHPSASVAWAAGPEATHADDNAVGQRVLRECRPCHRGRWMCGGDDGGVFRCGEFGLRCAVAWQQYRIRPEEISHARHGLIVQLGCTGSA